MENSRHINLYEWLCMVFSWASDSDTSRFVTQEDYSDGLSNFLDLAATQYARLMVWEYADDKRFGKKRFEHEREYFAAAVLRLLTEFSPVYSDITIRLRYVDHPWEDMCVDGHEWKWGKETPWDEKDTYHEIKWGLEYSDWNEWLGMTVNHEFFEAPADVVLAHVIWEMTYNGQPNTKEYEQRAKWLNEGPNGAEAFCASDGQAEAIPQPKESAI